jgi:hypothetical protein
MRFHEFEDFGGIESVSRANQAAAFDSMSRSVSSCRTRLRSRAISSRSLDVKPSLRAPASTSACLSQFRIVCCPTWNSAARSSDRRPERASSMILDRNSSGYARGRFLAMGGSFSAKRKVSTEPGQLHFETITSFSGRSLMPSNVKRFFRNRLGQQRASPVLYRGHCRRMTPSTTDISR